MSNQDNNKEKLRVYEYAKSLNMSSKEIITILKRLGIPVNNHMSVMENNTVDSVEKFFKDIKANAAAKRSSSAVSTVAKETAQQVTSQPQAQAPASAPAQPQVQQAKPEAEKTVQAASTQSAAPSSAAPAPAPRPAGSQSTQGSSNQTGGGSQGQQRSGYQGNRPQGQGSQQGGGYQQRSGQQGSGQGGYQQRSGQQGSGQGGYQQRSGQQGSGQGGYQQRSGQPSGGQQGGQGGGYQQRSSSQPSGGQSRPGGYQGGQGQQANRPSGTTGGNAGRPGDQRASRPQGQGTFEQRKPFEQRGAGSSGPFNKSVGARPVDNDQENAGGVNGKTAKKTKPNEKRFDDNKFSSSRGPQNNRGNNKGNNRGRYQQETVKKEKIDNTPKKIIVRGTMTVGEMAKSLHKDASEVIKKLLFLGVMATINQELDLDAIQLLASDYKVEVELKIPVEEDKFEQFEEKDEEEDLFERPPVVTIMGHVDHGKTTLLDAIRKTSVTEGEAGGITQHIGAYQVETHNKKITFLDTPGHEAFTSMRARGAQVTDITIIVVAADDGVMPQTVEAIAHAKAAKVPIIVAVNKVDKEGADPEKIKQALTEYELVPEEWGGDTIFCNISAKQRIGLENLLDMILLVAEVQEIKANPNKRARGTVIEAELDKGKGPVARVLIQHGTLRVGDSFVAGVCFGRVRAMVNDKGKKLKEAGPSTPVEITGLTEVPQAGDPFICFEDERKARAIAEKRAVTLRQSEMGANVRVTLDDLYKHIKDGEIKDLNVIIKGDVQGSVEALRGSLEKIDIEGVRVKILHHGVGAITESDVILASASNAIVIGFNVRPEPQAKNTADQEKVDIRLHSIIYKVMEEIEHAMKGMLDPIYKENIIGQAEVRNVFKVSKIGVIAGCMITSGKIARNAQMRLIRAGIVVFEGNIDSLKRFKDDAKEVSQGYECGISLDKFNDIKEGDIIEAFVMETVER
ncbi:translation initiation factor IF-2 [Paenibacillus radicis (ex Xue et al. 2023)]|uniref:Translation initiation factor IF-2 n=1 Tax=Paenibacillus radicis (ex Xue et al. 2023) TaxID=2972489 RepID=A0ABT1YC44_9BACL|nr:translation initiation factor IF-2 [Paenibacillus radicis (ex Xue et al. 2023)]MCR8630768.1 translation initiation factor IF-2 [Paenibacillus radicis (ex Xue et al. 2023)]